jgi:DNA-binding response OmpR family regulator
MPSRGFVLVVEDNPAFTRIVEARLEKGGYTVVMAADGLNGYAMARKLSPDLILLDLMLPDLDGHKVCRLIKFDANLRRIPIVIFTSRDSEYDRKLAKSSRADAFVAKTAAPEEMMEVVRHEMNKAVAAKMESGAFSAREDGEPAFRVDSSVSVPAGAAA